MPQSLNYATILKDIKSIAILGAKDTPNQAVDRVGRYLIDAGFTVYPVHPVRQNVWGLKTYKSIADIPAPIDLLDVFRASVHCVEHARECLKLLAMPKVFWMQLGIMNPEVQELFVNKDIQVVENACLMIEHKKIIK